MNLDCIVTAERKHSKNMGINIWRAIFAIWVICAHLFSWAVFSGQDGPILSALHQVWAAAAAFFQHSGALNPAVLGFIVLSGYCIHRNGIRALEKANLLKYMVKRIFRILPVFIIASISGILLLKATNSSGVAFILSGSQEPNLTAFTARTFGLTAFYPFYYPAVYQGNAPLLTVMVEIWLYILYPLWFFVLVRYGKIIFSVAILAMFVFGLVIQAVFEMPGWFQNASIYKFLLYWWIGAYFVSLPKPIFLLMPIALSMFLYIFAFFFGLKHVFFVEVFHIGLALLFGYFFRSLENEQTKLWIARFFSKVGDYGYSLYAFHAPIIIYCLHTGVHWTWTLIVLFIATFFIGQLIEFPPIKLGKNLSRRLR